MNKKRKITIAALLVAVIAMAAESQALTIGTFNVEYFTVEGKKAYTDQDCSHIARIILESGADLVALQEIGEDSSLEYLLKNHLLDWRYSGNQTEGKQNLYFIWNDKTVELISPAETLFLQEAINWEGQIVPLFRRHPIRASFREKSTQGTFTAINVHLRSLGTAGAKDRLAAVAMNNGIRQAQVIKLNGLAEQAEDVTFIMGDFNSVEVYGATFPIFPLTEGYSYDYLQCTIDHIGYVNVTPAHNWSIRAIESSIPRRKVGDRKHPDHNMVVLAMPDLFR